MILEQLMEALNCNVYCNYGLKKVICYNKGVQAKCTEAETACTSDLLMTKHNSHQPHFSFLFSFSFFPLPYRWIVRDCDVVIPWLPSPCSVSGRQRGSVWLIILHYGFWLNQCGGSSGPYNEWGWNHRGQAEANSLKEQVPLERQPRYSLHLRQDCGVTRKCTLYSSTERQMSIWQWWTEPGSAL